MVRLDGEGLPRPFHAGLNILDLPRHGGDDGAVRVQGPFSRWRQGDQMVLDGKGSAADDKMGRVVGRGAHMGKMNREVDDLEVGTLSKVHLDDGTCVETHRRSESQMEKLSVLMPKQKEHPKPMLHTYTYIQDETPIHLPTCDWPEYPAQRQ
jgi:hypothetical protein